MVPGIIGSAPILPVKDAARSVDWYLNRLGFIGAALYGEPPNFGIIHRDEHYLMFCTSPPEKIVPNWKIVDKTSNVYFWVDDVDALYAEYTASGATIDYDPDDYDISFGQVMKSS